MNKILKEIGVAVGIGAASFACSAALTAGSVMYRYPMVRSPLITGVAVGALALAAKYATLDQEKSLEKRDYIVIGGSSLICGLLGHRVAKGFISAYVERRAQALGCSIIGTMFTNKLVMPFYMSLKSIEQ